ncbi:MAG: glutamate--cysteine ligase [Micrococcaceae bacterium]|nr:glutamate--cysteine ligase [Micrococcaceae bacterium]
MGAETKSSTFSREQRTRYRERLVENLETFDRLLSTSQFADQRSIGLELELNLVDEQFRPTLRNAAVLDEIANPAFQTEIGAYNIELNHPALHIAGAGLLRLEDGLRDHLNVAERSARKAGAGILMVGILPTITRELIDDDNWMSPEKRYAALNTSVLQARGEDVLIDIKGIEQLRFYARSVAPEAACTSVQLHLQLPPRDFAGAWNASQIIAGPQLALAANSPVFMEKLLWHESRIEVFKQSIDTRPPEMRNQGVRPRVWFGERWITSVFDLFEENVRYFPALLPETAEESGVGSQTSHGVPLLHELRLHNGTVYRWNRPIIDPHGDIPHLRVENRLLPAGPTVLDTVANAAFYYGLVAKLRRADRPLWTRMSFRTAADNFLACARDGLEASVYWPGVGDVPVDELLMRQLLPTAAEGLRLLEVDEDLIDRYMTVLRERTVNGQNGAAWQLSAVRSLEAGGLDRREALHSMTAAYSHRMHTNHPVHEWAPV